MPAPIAAVLAVAETVASMSSLAAPAAKALSADRIKATAQEFESVFLNNILEEMFAGVEEDGPFDAGPGSGAWRSLRTEEFAKTIARAGGIGLAEHVERQLIALQESQS